MNCAVDVDAESQRIQIAEETVDELNRCLDELEHYQTTTRNLGSMAVQKVTTPSC